jgi:uncharacterized membrane protein
MRALEPRSKLETGRTWSRRVLIIAYLAAGYFHLTKADAFLLIMPDWVPYPRDVILATGVCEIVGAVALMTQPLRRMAGYAFALYAICVFPANIKHAFYGVPLGQTQLGWWYHAPRLLLQPVIVWWALFAGEIIDWPFKRR